MKVRNGFVSNSSSSSFIVGIGVITDDIKFKAYQKRVDDIAGKYDVDFTIYNPSTCRTDIYSDLEINERSFVATGGANSEPEVSVSKDDYYSLDQTKEQKIVILAVGNNEGDSAFYPPDFDWDKAKSWEYPELNYDIDLDWFTNAQQKAYNEFGEESGISFADIMFGADRNG